MHFVGVAMDCLKVFFYLAFVGYKRSDLNRWIS